MDEQNSSESIELSDQPSSGRRRLMVGAGGAAGVALIVAAVAIAGRGDGGSVATATSSSVMRDLAASTSSAAPSIDVSRLPVGYPDWQSGAELAKVTLPSGELLRFVETTDGRNLCFVREQRGSVGASCSGLIPPGQYVQSPELVPSGDPTTGWYYTIVLPRDLPQFTLRDETGATVPFARGRDGRYVVTIQPDRSAAGPPGRRFDLIGVDGQRIAQVALANQPGPFGDPRSGSEVLKVELPSGDFVQIIENPDHRSACVLYRNSSACLDFASFPEVRTARLLPSGAPGAGSLYYPFIVPNDFPSAFTIRDATGLILPHGRSSNGRLLLIVDPKAPAPQIPPTNAGPPTAAAVRTFAVVAPSGQVSLTISTASPPSEPSPPHIALAACLRAQGLDVADPPSAANPTLAPARVYPAAAAYAAWTACRDGFNSSVPASTSSQLAFVDCMARQGWLMAIAAGPPADSAAHADAARRCN